ncbi:peptidyl-prolyl cis-trans isomerase CYP18-1 [Senna tora]|uniref:Peptidyl-prolyl cis-trans isomerase CYP18-1 n=1 Tax=Senna tora TaxID=362788 RepID=A0A834XJ32_9FABA|nr:peptidyl-prolyl cis-trans isomerase CYP18-1 [Senna tora]
MSVTLHTNLGDIKCEIFCDEVPKTSERQCVLGLGADLVTISAYEAFEW